MKDAKLFWDVIARYNSTLWVVELALTAILAVAIARARARGRRGWRLAASLSTAASLAFVGIAFFYISDGSSIAVYAAGPLFVASAILFALRGPGMRPSSGPRPFDLAEAAAWALVAAYPLASLLVGHRFPAMVLPLLPCPMAAVALLYLSGEERPDLLASAPLLAWAATGIPKAFIFDVPEDLILGLIGIYAAWRIIASRRRPAKVA
jgi:hypothetical protein